MKSSVLVAIIFVAGFGRLTHAAVEVTVSRVEDTRAVELSDDKVSRPPSGLLVVLSLHGPEAEASVRYGDLKLEEAVDDQGSSLIPAKDPFDDAAKFKDYANAFFRNSKFGNTQPAAPQVELKLASPRRAATKIARLRGSVTLSDQGAIQAVELSNLQQTGKRKLVFPPGVDLGVTAEVAAGDDVRSIAIETSGDEKILESIEVVDASGRKVSSGMANWSMNGGPAHKSIQLEKPVDGSMKLVTKFAVNRKLTVVPIELKDVPLP